MKKLFFSLSLMFSFLISAQDNLNNNPFKQLLEELPSPNVYRTAAGFPGHEYYQQKADYDIQIELDDENQIIHGSESIIYYNNSPNSLPYLWVQLDQNVRARDSDSKKIRTASIGDSISFLELERMMNDFDGGFKLDYVKDASGKNLKHSINKTMMRIDLDEALKPGSSFSFKIKWWYNINDRMKIGGRSGYEYFEEDSNYLYTIAQFFPRMAVYNDVEGWQNKQFLGRGEFTLPFGDYNVSITVPDDHLVAATGSIQNESTVLSSKQRNRLKKALDSDIPIMIVTEAEAKENEKARSKGTKTWVFEAENVRDFAFASSRKFIWDAMGVKFGKRTVLAMSFYPKEGNPLWEQYSTRAVAHTLRSYSSHTFDYPYPVAISVNAAQIGMEYPMICFNFGRPEEDGTYTDRLKYGMISVIIHEVGHNFFPMIVNSDERQWTWMDEGLNTFLQYLAEQEWDVDYPSRRGPAHKIVDYMKGDKSTISAIMTNSESIHQFGNNAYGKPATALNILRTTIMGPELFDHAFKQYSQTWKFKHPTPADFFRMMEDASAVDLDWFWRGWFYSSNHVDISLDNLRMLEIDNRDPQHAKKVENTPFMKLDYKGPSLVEKDSMALDFYNKYDPNEVDALDKKQYKDYYNSLSENQKQILSSKKYFYQIAFSMIGKLPMPIILEFEFEDGSKEKQMIPAEIWRFEDESVSKVFYFDKKVMRVVLDPDLETADTDRNNNYWPAQVEPSRFRLYKQREENKENPMQRAKRVEEMEK